MQRKTTAFLIILIINFSIFTSLIPLGAPQDLTNVTIHFLDVGQGDSIFIDTSNKDVLIDGGPASASEIVLDYLADLNITHIHLVIATHMHADHIGGLIDVLNSTLTIDEVLINNQTQDSDTYQSFNTTLQEHTVTIAQRGQTINLTESANLTVINPTQPLEFIDQNDNSIVVKLQAGNTSFLFTGDAEEDAEGSMLVQSVVSLKCDLLKIGHHGSDTATSKVFLDIVDPQYAIISAGLNNQYGHPHNVTIQKLLTNNVTTYCTIDSKTIIAQTDGITITFPSNPQPISEFHNYLLISILAMATTIIIIIYRIKLQK
jgi:competence protein ComEC